ncbi:MAG: DMT family transporter [Bryobacteraceae bacterium]
MTSGVSNVPDVAPARKAPSDARLYGLLVLMVLFWSVNFVIGKYALNRLPALFVAALRTLLAGAIIWPVYWWKHQRKKTRARWRPKEFLGLLALCLAGVPLNQIFFVVGLSRTSAIHAAIGIGLGPLLVLGVAAAAGQERMTWRKLAGMVLALTGVAVLEMGRGAGNGATFLGDFYIFLSALVMSIFTVVGKNLTTRYDGVTIFTFAYVGGGIALLPLALWEAAQVPLGAINLDTWLCVLYMAAFPAVLSYLIYYYALTYIAASRVSVMQYGQPLLASVLAIALLGEHPTVPLVAGGAVVLTGVTLTERG